MRRRLIIIIVLLIIIGGGLFYNKVRNQSTTQPSGMGIFFPVGENTNPQLNDTNTDDSGAIPGVIQTSSIPERFTQITSRPVAGYTTFSETTTLTVPGTTPQDKPTAQTIIDSVIRYVSRPNGFVYEVRNNNTPLQISNIYIPNIYEAFFMDNNKSAVLRFLQPDNKTISTYIVPIPDPNPDNTRTQREGRYLPSNILSMDISPTQTSLARLTYESYYGAITLSDSKNTAKKEILRTPFKDWLVLWPSEKNVYVQTKAANSVEGFLYAVDQPSKKLKRVLGNIPGLTVSISPNTTSIIYSQNTQDGFVSRLYNTKTGTLKDLGVSILPEKCVWRTNGNAICAGNSSISPGIYPDAWYAGLISFSDAIYEIDTTKNTIAPLFNDSTTSFDMTNLKLNEDKGLLYFIDKPTGTLWQFTL